MATIDWAAAHESAGRFLAELCAAADVDRSGLDRQTVAVDLVDHDTGEGTAFQFDYSAARTPSPLDQANAAAVAARDEFDNTATGTPAT